jgi:hypothetical protein
VEYLKAILLGPVAFAGMMIPMAIAFPSGSIAEFFLILGLTLAFHSVPVLMLVIAWRKPNAITLDHSGCVWTFLIGIAYGLGWGLGIVAFLIA